MKTVLKTVFTNSAVEGETNFSHTYFYNEENIFRINKVMKTSNLLIKNSNGISN